MRSVTGLRIHPLDPGQLGSVLRVWNDAAIYDPMTAALAREKIWSDPDFDSDLALAATVGDVLAGFAVGVARASSRAFVKLLAVHPDWQRRGIGRELLKTLEILLRLRGASSIRWLESAPNYLAPGIDRRNAAATAFVRAMGYSHVGETHNMTVDLAFELPPANPPDRTVDMRRARVEDRDRLVDFLTPRWAAWIPEVLIALGNDPPSLFIAARNDGIVGFAAWDANNVGTGWFGPMGVDENNRGSGVGCVLLRQCLHEIRAQGLNSAIIPWVGPGGFYERCAGAQADRDFDRFEKSFA